MKENIKKLVEEVGLLEGKNRDMDRLIPRMEKEKCMVDYEKEKVDRELEEYRKKFT